MGREVRVRVPSRPQYVSAPRTSAWLSCSVIGSAPTQVAGMKSCQGFHLFRFVSSARSEQRLYTAEVEGSNPSRTTLNALLQGCRVSLAQIVERLPEEQEVASASLAGDT